MRRSSLCKDPLRVLLMERWLTVQLAKLRSKEPRRETLSVLLLLGRQCDDGDFARSLAPVIIKARHHLNHLAE